MKSVTLNNGYEIPQIGYGTFPQKETLVQNVPLAIQHGYAMIDTSDNYQNERFVGECLQKIEGGIKDITVISKFSQPLRSVELSQCFRESKEALGGHLDIYLMHWPYPFLWKQQWKKMENLYNQGKCKAIGVCNFKKERLEQLLSFCTVKPAINQFERHPMFQQNDLYQYCVEKDIQVICYSPMARMNEELLSNSTLKEIAEKYNKTVGQIILRWDIDHNCIPIPASASEKHIIENIDIFDFKLSPEEMEKIDSLERGLRVRYDPDTRFGRRTKLKFLLYKMRNMRKLKKDDSSVL